MNIICQVLDLFGKNLANVAFFVGDCCSTNQALANLTTIPLVACFSHRFALEVNRFSLAYEQTFKKIDVLFAKLRHIKNRMVLETFASIVPARRNVTRWSSTIAMLESFIKLVDQKVFNCFGDGIDALVPDKNEVKDVRAVVISYQKFNVLTKHLQIAELDVLGTMQALDLFHASVPEMTSYQTNCSDKHSLIFESALLKVLRQQEYLLSPTEKISLVKLTAPDRVSVAVFSQSEATELQQSLNSISKRVTTYLDLTFIPDTSNTCERLFSAAKRAIG
ncbi:hypothetical protein RCL1_005500 [Eukaryota sp. TZLM3-RCL]